MIESYQETINDITYDVTYLENNFKEYRLNNKLHNESGPAIIYYYYYNGNIRQELYFLNGKLHNEFGPANILFYKSGDINSSAYYIFGNHFYSLKEVKEYLKFKNF